MRDRFPCLERERETEGERAPVAAIAMPVLAVSLPLDPLLSNSYWAWFIALCVATIATFSRLSLFSFFMHHKPISSFASSRHVKIHLQLVMEENTSSKEEQTASKSNEALCVEKEGFEKGNPWSVLHQQCSAGEENEAEEEKEVPPPWVSSLLEASRTPPEASTTALEAPRACTSCVQATSWSQSLHRQISARVGIPWHYIETRVGMPLHHQATLPCLADCLCSPKVSKVWSCQQLQILQLLQVPNMTSTMSAAEVGTHDGFAHVGYCGGGIALWDVEKRVCLSSLHTRKSPVTALRVASSYPMVAIAAGPNTLNQGFSVVSIWDNRCASRSANFILSTAASPMTALGCRAHEFGIAGESFLSMHDLRMLRGSPIVLYSAQSLGKSAWGGQGKKERGPYFKEYEVNNAQEVEEEADKYVEEEADEYIGMDKVPFPSTNHVEVNHASTKRRCSFIINCLSFICCLVQNP